MPYLTPTSNSLFLNEFPKTSTWGNNPFCHHHLLTNKKKKSPSNSSKKSHIKEERNKHKVTWNSAAFKMQLWWQMLRKGKEMGNGMILSCKQAAEVKIIN